MPRAEVDLDLATARFVPETFAENVFGSRGRRADAQATFEHIGRATLAEVRAEDLAFDSRDGGVMFTVRPHQPRDGMAKAVVRVNRYDYYDAAIVAFDRRSLDSKVIASCEAPYGLEPHQLGAWLREVLSTNFDGASA